MTVTERIQVQPEWVRVGEHASGESKYLALAAGNAGMMAAGYGQDGFGVVDVFDEHSRHVRRIHAATTASATIAAVCAYDDGLVFAGYREAEKRSLSLGISAHDPDSKKHLIVERRDAAGELVWAWYPEFPGGSQALGVTRDAHGNVFVAGFVQSRESFDPGNGKFLHPPADTGNAFLACLNSEGVVVWAWVPEDARWGSRLEAVTVDRSSRIWVAGSICGKETFHLGNNLSVSAAWSVGTNETLRQADADGNNALVACFSQQGHALSAAVPMGTCGESRFRSIALVGDDLVVVGGSVAGTPPIAFGVNQEKAEEELEGCLASIDRDPSEDGVYLVVGFTIDNNGFDIRTRWIFTPEGDTSYSICNSIVVQGDKILTGGRLQEPGLRHFGLVPIRGSGPDSSLLLVILDREGDVLQADISQDKGTYSVCNALAVGKDKRLWVAGRTGVSDMAKRGTLRLGKNFKTTIPAALGNRELIGRWSLSE